MVVFMRSTRLQSCETSLLSVLCGIITRVPLGHLVAIGTSVYHAGVYEKYIKRGFDIVLSLVELIVIWSCAGFSCGEYESVEKMCKRTKGYI